MTFFFFGFSVNSAQTLSGLPDKVSSESEGNPPLWVSRVKQNGREEIYINNAKVVQAKSNFEHLTEAGKKQVIKSCIFITSDWIILIPCKSEVLRSFTFFLYFLTLYCIIVRESIVIVQIFKFEFSAENRFWNQLFPKKGKFPNYVCVCVCVPFF